MAAPPESVRCVHFQRHADLDGPGLSPVAEFALEVRGVPRLLSFTLVLVLAACASPTSAVEAPAPSEGAPDPTCAPGQRPVAGSASCTAAGTNAVPAGFVGVHGLHNGLQVGNGASFSAKRGQPAGAQQRLRG